MHKIIFWFLLLLNLVLVLKIFSVTHFFAPIRYQPDFDNYYHTVNDMRLSINPYKITYMQNLGPPLVFLYFYPFTLFSLHTAQSLNLVINLLSGYLACLVLTIKYFRKNQLVWFLILSVILYSVFTSRYSLQIGQPMLLVTLLISLTISLPRSHPFILSALIAIKSFFLISLFTLIPHPKKLITTLIVFLTTITLSFVIIRPTWYFDYFTRRLPGLQFTTPPNSTPGLEYENQSLRSTTKRLGLSSLFPIIYTSAIAFSIIVMLKRPSLELGLVFSFILSPVLWQHYLIALFPIFIKMLLRVINLKSYLLYLISLLLWFPDLRLWNIPSNLFTGLLASHFFISLILLAIIQYLAANKQLSYN